MFTLKTTFSLLLLLLAAATHSSRALDVELIDDEDDFNEIQKNIRFRQFHIDHVDEFHRDLKGSSKGSGTKSPGKSVKGSKGKSKASKSPKSFKSKASKSPSKGSKGSSKSGSNTVSDITTRANPVITTRISPEAKKEKKVEKRVKRRQRQRARDAANKKEKKTAKRGKARARGRDRAAQDKKADFKRDETAKDGQKNQKKKKMMMMTTTTKTDAKKETASGPATKEERSDPFPEIRTQPVGIVEEPVKEIKKETKTGATHPGNQNMNGMNGMMMKGKKEVPASTGNGKKEAPASTGNGMMNVPASTGNGNMMGKKKPAQKATDKEQMGMGMGMGMKKKGGTDRLLEAFYDSFAAGKGGDL